MRETQNIFYYIFRCYYSRAWYLLKTFDKTTRLDTWKHIVKNTYCKVFSHVPYLSNDSLFCKNCGKILKDLNNVEVKQFNREQKLKRLIK